MARRAGARRTAAHAWGATRALSSRTIAALLTGGTARLVGPEDAHGAGSALGSVGSFPPPRAACAPRRVRPWVLAALAAVLALGTTAVTLTAAQQAGAAVTGLTAGYTALYDASNSGSITSASGLVSSVADGGSGSHAATSSGTAKPTTGTATTVNGTNAFGFDGSDDVLTSGETMTDASSTTCEVVKLTDLSTYYALFSSSANGGLVVWVTASTGVVTAQVQASSFSSGNTIATSSNAISAGTTTTVCLRVTSSASTLWVGATATTGVGKTFSGGGTLSIGGGVAGLVSQYKGAVGAFVRYHTALTDGEVATVQSALTASFTTTTTTTSTTTTAPPTTTTTVATYEVLTAAVNGESDKIELGLGLLVFIAAAGLPLAWVRRS